MGQYDTSTDATVGRKGFREISTTERTVRIPDLAVSDLTLSEKLLVWRRREGYTQRQAAIALGISITSYNKIERQETKCVIKTMPHLGDLYSFEICFVLRRRSGWTIPMCAEQAGVSRYWYNLMEQGKVSCDRMIEYWGDNEG